MSWQELKAYQPLCVGCMKTGPVQFVQYSPKLPSDWSTKHLDDCGMTGYSRDDFYCGDCTVRRRREGKT